MKIFFRGLLDSSAIALGYFPVSFSFGMVAVQNNLPPVAAILVSVLIFAGASQFILVSLLAVDAGAISIVVAVLSMNLRHLFYGTSIAAKLKNSKKNLPLPFLAFGLTDEVYAIAIEGIERQDRSTKEKWYFGLQSGAYFSWVIGTLFGVLLGKSLGNQNSIINDVLDILYYFQKKRKKQCRKCKSKYIVYYGVLITQAFTKKNTK
jgi:4-azaleucine resistance transporter AzlC